MIAVVIGVILAVVLHAGVLAFGGLLFPGAKEGQGTLQEVELLAPVEAEDEKKQEEEPEPTDPADELEAEVEEAPDAGEIIRNLELSAAAAQPKLEAASLSAIADALRGNMGGGMGLGDAMSFGSGGVIGGTGTASAIQDELEGAFDLTEIDQKARAVFQAAPRFPAEMRGKKVEGLVTVICVVDAAGKVVDPRVEKSSHVAFEKPALDAVRQWKYEPAVKAGQRVPSKMRIPIRFAAS